MLWTKDNNTSIGSGFLWAVSSCSLLFNNLISESIFTVYFLTICVLLGRGHEECIRLILRILFSLRFSTVHMINMFVAQPPKWLFVYSSVVDCTHPPQSHTGPMLIILSTLTSLLIVAGLFILEIKLSLERLWVAANTDQPGRLMIAYQVVWWREPPRHADTDLNGCIDGVIIFMPLI